MDFLITHRSTILALAIVAAGAIFVLAWVVRHRGRNQHGFAGWLGRHRSLAHGLEPRPSLFSSPPRIVEVQSDPGSVRVCEASIAAHQGSRDDIVRALRELLDFITAQGVTRVVLEMTGVRTFDRFQFHWLHSFAYELSRSGGVLTLVWHDDLPELHPWSRAGDALPYHRIPASTPSAERASFAANAAVLAIQPPGDPIPDEQGVEQGLGR